MLHSICLFIGLCREPPKSKGNIKPSDGSTQEFDQHKAFIEYWKREGFEPPSEEEPDGRIPLDWIYQYDLLGRPLNLWWKEESDFYPYPKMKDFHKI